MTATAAKLSLYITVSHPVRLEIAIPGGVVQLHYRLTVVFRRGDGATRAAVAEILAGFASNPVNLPKDPERICLNLHDVCQKTVAGLHSVAVYDGAEEVTVRLEV